MPGPTTRIRWLTPLFVLLPAAASWIVGWPTIAALICGIAVGLVPPCFAECESEQRRNGGAIGKATSSREAAPIHLGTRVSPEDTVRAVPVGIHTEIVFEAAAGDDDGDAEVPTVSRETGNDADVSGPGLDQREDPVSPREQPAAVEGDALLHSSGLLAGSLPDLAKALRIASRQLETVVDDTNGAAESVIRRLQGIDKVVTDLVATVEAANRQATCDHQSHL